MERYLRPQPRNASLEKKTRAFIKPSVIEESKKHCERDANQMHIGVFKAFNDSEKLTKITQELEDQKDKETKYLKIINELKHMLARQNEQITKLTKENDRYRRKIESSRQEDIELQLAMRLSAMDGLDPDALQAAMLSGDIIDTEM